MISFHTLELGHKTLEIKLIFVCEETKLQILVKTQELFVEIFFSETLFEIVYIL